MKNRSGSPAVKQKRRKCNLPIDKRPKPRHNRNLHAGRPGNTRDETRGIIEAAEKMPLLMGEKLGIEIV